MSAEVVQRLLGEGEAERMVRSLARRKPPSRVARPHPFLLAALIGSAADSGRRLGASVSFTENKEGLGGAASVPLITSRMAVCCLQIDKP